MSVSDRGAATGWRAELDLLLRPSAGRTVLGPGRRLGPLTVQRPFHPEGDCCHLYLLHPPGGVVGGDRLELRVTLAPEASGLITTPCATKLYRSAGAGSTQDQRLVVGAGASLDWLPQENICFAGTRLRSRTRIDLATDARFLGWEVHCLGRPACGERFEAGEADLGLRLYRDGRPMLMDRLRITNETLALPSGLKDHAVTATLLAAPAGPKASDAARGLIGQSGDPIGGATRLDDLLVVRLLARSTQMARSILEALWQVLRPLVLGREPCPPRIWAT
jgi:urease accessory protein